MLPQLIPLRGRCYELAKITGQDKVRRQDRAKEKDVLQQEEI